MMAFLFVFFGLGRRSRSGQDCTTTIYLLFRVTFSYIGCLIHHILVYRLIRLEYRLKRKLFFTILYIIAIMLISFLCLGSDIVLEDFE
jgi:hypothetical protein